MNVIEQLQHLQPPDSMLCQPSRLHWSLYDWTLNRGGPFTDRTYCNVQRAAFDSWLLDAACARNNVQIWPATSFDGFFDEAADGHMRLLFQRDGEGLEVGARHVIGADGCTSVVRKALGIKSPARWMTIQETVRPHGIEVGRFLAFIGGDIEHYGWVIPKDDLLTVGIGCSTGGSKPLDSLRRFKDGLRRFHGIDGVSVGDPRARMITRLRKSRELFAGRGRVLLAGEAAGLVCPWSGEGISYAVRSGSMAGSSLRARSPLRRYRLHLKTLMPSVYFDLLARRSMKRPWARKLIALGAPGVYFPAFGTAPDKPADSCQDHRG